LRLGSPVGLGSRWNCGPQGSAPNEENLFLLPDRFQGANSQKWRSSRLTWCLADTLFRRPEPAFKIRFEKQTIGRLVWRAGIKPPAIFQKRDYFFFLATLRVFFAVFFTALFAFFAFLAFLAMLPS
jgi:hypothetical protein